MKTPHPIIRAMQVGASCVFLASCSQLQGPPVSPTGKPAGEVTETSPSIAAPENEAPAAASNDIGVTYTSNAWKEMDRGNHPAAIAEADKCIQMFQNEAQRIERLLEAQGANLPVGAVSPAMKKKIHANGPLNDVATCLFIKAKCLDSLGKTKEAADQRKILAQYPHARTWDPQGWFWAPASS